MSLIDTDDYVKLYLFKSITYTIIWDCWKN